MNLITPVLCITMKTLKCKNESFYIMASVRPNGLMSKSLQSRSILLVMMKWTGASQKIDSKHKDNGFKIEGGGAFKQVFVFQQGLIHQKFHKSYSFLLGIQDDGLQTSIHTPKNACSVKTKLLLFPGSVSYPSHAWCVSGAGTFRSECFICKFYFVDFIILVKRHHCV